MIIITYRKQKIFNYIHQFANYIHFGRNFAVTISKEFSSKLTPLDMRCQFVV